MPVSTGKQKISSRSCCTEWVIFCCSEYPVSAATFLASFSGSFQSPIYEDMLNRLQLMEVHLEVSYGLQLLILIVAARSKHNNYLIRQHKKNHIKSLPIRSTLNDNSSFLKHE
jgi:hypothetical protein